MLSRDQTFRFVDSHTHVHDSEFYPENREEVYQQAVDAGVLMICVGTDVRSSREAVAFARSHDGCLAVVGIHPHEAKDNNSSEIRKLLDDNHDGVIVGIGEIGLDYFYDHSPKTSQQRMLREQIQLAQDYDLPISFHVREAFDDFWPIFDEFVNLRGVLHSFTDIASNLQAGLERGLLIGINGISTFTRDEAQLKLYQSVPLSKILLETDAPFLTPKPFRGKMNVPAYVELVAQNQASIRGLDIDTIAHQTSANAKQLFGINDYE